MREADAKRGGRAEGRAQGLQYCRKSKSTLNSVLAIKNTINKQKKSVSTTTTAVALSERLFHSLDVYCWNLQTYVSRQHDKIKHSSACRNSTVIRRPAVLVLRTQPRPSRGNPQMLLPCNTPTRDPVTPPPDTRKIYTHNHFPFMPLSRGPHPRTQNPLNLPRCSPQGLPGA